MAPKKPIKKAAFPRVVESAIDENSGLRLYMQHST